MRVTGIPFTVLRFQYRLVRLPLALIEQRLMTRIDEEAAARLFYERSLGKLDVTVGSALGDMKLEKRGAALVERSETLSRAAKLDATATKGMAQADADMKASRDKVIDDQRQAREEKQQNIADARTEAEERKRDAAEGAQKRTASAKAQADELAAKRQESAEQAKRDKLATIRSAEDKARAASKSKLQDAQAIRGEASSKRVQADRIEELADVEKQKRQKKRANS